MKWTDWLGKENVFIKLTDGQIFSQAKIIDYEEPFLTFYDKFGYKATINVNHILKIKEEGNEKEE